MVSNLVVEIAIYNFDLFHYTLMMMEIIAMIMKKKTLLTPSLPLYPTICFNFGFAGNVMKRILTC